MQTPRLERCALWVVLASSVALADRPYLHGAVAAQHASGSAAGQEMLEAGGNAIDAAVATAFAMAVVGPYHSGIGGGGFALVHLVADGGADVAFDFREVAPAGASRDMYVRDGGVVPKLSTDGALAVAVPGAVKGYLELHAKYGRLPRAKVLAPAIRLAKQGFVVTPKYRDMARAREACLRQDAEASRIFLAPGADGGLQAPTVGTRLLQPDLAKTLEALAKSGDAPFYSGSIGQAVADTVRDAGGVLSTDDLKQFHTRWRTPLEGHYRGHRVLTMPPPSAGGIAMLQVLAMMEAQGPKGPASREVNVMHRFIESIRRAYVDRAASLGDPAFTQVPVEKLLSLEHLNALVASIDGAHATRSLTLVPEGLRAAMGVDGGTKTPPEKNTTHLSVVDRDGNAVAMTTTVNTAFGSCLVAKGTGVLLNNQMDDFASQPGVPNSYGLVQGEPNAIAPGKIPLSSMTPTFVFQKERPREVMLVVGSPGGSTIPTTVMQVISYVVDGQLGVVRAVGGGRIHHQWMPDDVLVDKTGLEPATQAALEAMGHTFKRIDAWGDAEAVMVDPVTGLRTAGSDPRNEGAPAGQD